MKLLNFAAMTHESAEVCNPILAYKAVNPDILRLHEAMKAKDQKEFKAAMEKEVNDQIENGNFTIIPRSKVPKGFRIFPGVWTLVGKRDILTHKIKKYKARLTFDGSRMREGEDYDKTYAPVVSWMSIRLLLTFVVAFGWHTQQVDYVAAYTQVPIDRDMYMEFPRGFQVPGGVDRKAFVLKLHRNLYGQKQARRVWYKYLSKRLITFDGSRMREGEDYDKTYAPVVSWMSIRLLLTFVVAFGWHTQQVDYVAAYTQVPIDRDMYMEFPRGFQVPGGVDRKAFVLKLHRNLYGQKQARRVWYKYLCKRLITKAGYVQSKHDESLFFRGKVRYALYIDDSILGAPTRHELDKAIKAIKDAKLQITLEGDLADFLGVKIEW